MARTRALGVATFGSPIGGRSYKGKVLSYNPLAYWVMDEGGGGTAYDSSGNGHSGSYVGVTLGQPGIGDGRSCPFFDGVNDYANMSSASVAAAWNGNVGGGMIWLRVANAGVLTDGTERAAWRAVSLTVANEVTVPRHTGNNQMRWRTKRNGTFVGTITAETSTDWHAYQCSWDTNNFYLYRDASLLATVPLVQPWSSALEFLLVGAISTIPSWTWHGWLAHFALFDYTVGLPIWQDLAVI